MAKTHLTAYTLDREELLRIHNLKLLRAHLLVGGTARGICENGSSNKKGEPDGSPFKQNLLL